MSLCCNGSISGKDATPDHPSCNHSTTITHLANTHLPHSLLLHERALSHINLVWLCLGSRAVAWSSWAHLYWTWSSQEGFHALIRELLSMGHGHSRYVTLDEQLAIFLCVSVTGLSIHHVGEWFQHANGIISKWVFQLLVMTIY